MPVRNEWLIRKASVAEWEAEFLINGVAFGLCNREWEALKAKIQPGDEIWFWSTDEESWARMSGLDGMALVRQGVIVDSFITALN